jgi:hypothetical protein
MTGSLSTEFLQEKIRQFADVSGPKQFDTWNRQAQRLLNKHCYFSAVDRIGSKIGQPIGGDELMGIEARQHLPRMPRNKIEHFRLGHDKLSAAV